MKLIWQEYYIYIITIVGIWLVAILLVNPEGNFPLNDDWAYAKPVKGFIEQGKFTFTDWPAMTLIIHLLMGVLFTKLFGFSFDALRSYVLLCGLLSLLYVFLIYRKTASSNCLSFIAVLLLLFNPLFFSLSFTYMTDVPFFCFCCASIYYNLEFTDKKNLKTFIIATLVNIAAVLIRQPAIIIPFAFIVYYLLNYSGNKRQVVYYFIQLILTGMAMVIYEFYVRYKIGYPHNFVNRNVMFLDALKHNPLYILKRQFMLDAKSLYSISLYTLALTPFIIYLLNKNFTKKTLFIIVFLSTVIGIAFTYTLKLIDKDPPFILARNVVINCGIGPIAFSNSPFQLPLFFWLCVTFISITVNNLLLVLLVKLLFKKGYKNLLSDIMIVFPLVAIVCYMPLVTVLKFYDRYLILPLFLFCWLFLRLIADYKFKISGHILLYICSAIIILVFSLFSVLATKDYLGWNRARWQVLYYLTNEKKVSPYDINGGFEYNGWYKYVWMDRDSSYISNISTEKYRISFFPIKGYYINSSIYYQRYLPYRKEAILLLERNGQYSSGRK